MGESERWTVAIRHRLAKHLMQRVRVDRLTGCWEWQRSKRGGGYGQVYVDRIAMSAHRVSYCAFVGPIPEGRVIHHTCDNRPCVNPAHLECTTQGWNVRYGKRSPFTIEEVRQIRRRAADGESYASIGRDKGVTDRGISGIARHKTWKEVV